MASVIVSHSLTPFLKMNCIPSNSSMTNNGNVSSRINMCDKDRTDAFDDEASTATTRSRSGNSLKRMGEKSNSSDNILSLRQNLRRTSGHSRNIGGGEGAQNASFGRSGSHNLLNKTSLAGGLESASYHGKSAIRGAGFDNSSLASSTRSSSSENLLIRNRIRRSSNITSIASAGGIGAQNSYFGMAKGGSLSSGNLMESSGLRRSFNNTKSSRLAGQNASFGSTRGSLSSENLSQGSNLRRSSKIKNNGGLNSTFSEMPQSNETKNSLQTFRRPASGGDLLSQSLHSNSSFTTGTTNSSFGTSKTRRRQDDTNIVDSAQQSVGSNRLQCRRASSGGDLSSQSLHSTVSTATAKKRRHVYKGKPSLTDLMAILRDDLNLDSSAKKKLADFDANFDEMQKGVNDDTCSTTSSAKQTSATRRGSLLMVKRESSLEDLKNMFNSDSRSASSKAFRKERNGVSNSKWGEQSMPRRDSSLQDLKALFDEDPAGGKKPMDSANAKWTTSSKPDIPETPETPSGERGSAKKRSSLKDFVAKFDPSKAKFRKDMVQLKKKKRAELESHDSWNQRNKVFPNVCATHLNVDTSTFVAPVFPKTPSQMTMIESSIKENFVFKGILSADGTGMNKSDPGAANANSDQNCDEKEGALSAATISSLVRRKLVDAMEPIEVKEGEILEKLGEIGEDFYIVTEGKIDFQVDGIIVGGATAGGSFGAINLLHGSVNKQTACSADKSTKLLKINQSTFRSIMQTIVPSSSKNNHLSKLIEASISNGHEKEEMPAPKRSSSVRAVLKSKVGLSDLEKISILGEGQFGEVWLVKANISGAEEDEFALKIQNKDVGSCAQEAKELLKNEVKVMKKLDHPFISRLLHAFEDKQSHYMLMELYSGGELWDLIHKQDANDKWTSGMQEAHAKFYAMILADALSYIHSKRILYRDLKPENVMICGDGYPVIVDFGMSKRLRKNEQMSYTFCCTPNYAAPELILNVGHSVSVDHWALGVVIYEMILGENPFYYHGMEEAGVYKAIVEDEYYPLPDDPKRYAGGCQPTNAAVDIIDRLLRKDPSTRLGMLSGGDRDILQHFWFDGLDLEMLRSKRVAAPSTPSMTTGIENATNSQAELSAPTDAQNGATASLEDASSSDCGSSLTDINGSFADDDLLEKVSKLAGKPAEADGIIGDNDNKNAETIPLRPTSEEKSPQVKATSTASVGESTTSTCASTVDANDQHDGDDRGDTFQKKIPDSQERNNAKDVLEDPAPLTISTLDGSVATNDLAGGEVYGNWFLKSKKGGGNSQVQDHKEEPKIVSSLSTEINAEPNTWTVSPDVYSDWYQERVHDDGDDQTVDSSSAVKESRQDKRDEDLTEADSSDIADKRPEVSANTVYNNESADPSAGPKLYRKWFQKRISGRNLITSDDDMVKEARAPSSIASGSPPASLGGENADVHLKHARKASSLQLNDEGILSPRDTIIDELSRSIHGPDEPPALPLTTTSKKKKKKKKKGKSKKDDTGSTKSLSRSTNKMAKFSERLAVLEMVSFGAKACGGTCLKDRIDRLERFFFNDNKFEESAFVARLNRLEEFIM